uniref:Uncharacterized protein n=1 Tax=Mustela putorius furo TaxID=9669 RepID=M3XS80_MUSPF
MVPTEGRRARPARGAVLAPSFPTAPPWGQDARSFPAATQAGLGFPRCAHPENELKEDRFSVPGRGTCTIWPMPARCSPGQPDSLVRSAQSTPSKAPGFKAFSSEPPVLGRKHDPGPSWGVSSMNQLGDGTSSRDGTAAEGAVSPAPPEVPATEHRIRQSGQKDKGG